ncbi:single-stranded DNA-binding protein [candidate division KSB1 bacterium]|nr:single-stranded DNA-binding protein [candidate division KSB1 bacterium]
MLNLKMPDINNVIIAGNLTCDPSFRKTTNGTPVANFFIASNRKFKDNSGQWRENVCYVGVVAWYKLAESCYENLKRGSAIIVDGELQSRNWRNNDGTSHNVVEIKARRIQFLNRKNQTGDDDDNDKYREGSNEEETDYDDDSSTDDENSTVYDFGYKDLNL